MAGPLIRLAHGNTYVNLNTSPVYTTGHTLTGPNLEQQSVTAGRDKQNLAVPSWRNATETLELLITGATASAIKATVRSIETMLDNARQSARTWRGSRIYLEVQTTADSNYWRSEILAGKLELEKPLDAIALGHIEGRLILTRRFYWEGQRTALQLSTEANPTPSTAERILHLTDDATAGQRNYINIAAAQITGVLSAPIELQLRNNEESSKAWRNYYVSNTVHMDPDNLDPILRGSEAEDGATNNWSGDDEELSHVWMLTAAQTEDIAGQYCRLLAWVTSAPNAYLRAAVTWHTLLFLPIAMAPMQRYVDGGGIWDLGAVPIPPGGYSEGAVDVGIAILGQKSGGGSLTIDYVHLMPAGYGLYRHVRQLGFNVPSTYAFVDDGPEELVYLRRVSDSAIAPIMQPYGTPLMLWPAAQNRLRVMISGSTKGDSVGAQAWYRPRRISI